MVERAILGCAVEFHWDGVSKKDGEDAVGVGVALALVEGWDLLAGSCGGGLGVTDLERRGCC